MQIYSFNGLTLHANDNDCSDVNSKAFVLKILADRQERINYPEPEYEHLHNNCTEDEIHSLERFGWYEDSLPQFHLIDPHYNHVNEVPQGDAGSSLERRKGKKGLRDADAQEWFNEKSKDSTWNINCMTEKDIINALKNREIAKESQYKLWASDFTDWNRGQTIWPKRKAGKKPLMP